MIEREKPVLASTARVTCPRCAAALNREPRVLRLPVTVFILSHVSTCKYQPGCIWHREHPEAPVWQMGPGSQWNLTVPGGLGAPQRPRATGERLPPLPKTTVRASRKGPGRKIFQRWLGKPFGLVAAFQQWAADGQAVSESRTLEITLFCLPLLETRQRGEQVHSRQRMGPPQTLGSRPRLLSLTRSIAKLWRPYPFLLCRKKHTHPEKKKKVQSARFKD